MKYYSAKGKMLPIVMLILLIGTILMITEGAWPGVIIFMLIEGLFIWIWFDTYYIINDGKIYYKSAFLKGAISISIIHEVKKHKGIYAGTIKPGLSMEGLILKYNRYDDMYLSPEREDEFIAELQKINPDIKVS